MTYYSGVRPRSKVTFGNFTSGPGPKVKFLLRLQVGILAGDVVDAGARLLRIEVVMAYDQGAGITPVQIFEQLPHGCLLRLGARVGGLTPDVEPALVADADRVSVVVLAVGACQPFRTTGLYLSVTTDNVVVADAEVETPLAMPCVDLSRRRKLVGPHCRTMNDN